MDYFFLDNSSNFEELRREKIDIINHDSEYYDEMYESFYKEACRAYAKNFWIAFHGNDVCFTKEFVYKK